MVNVKIHVSNHNKIKKPEDYSIHDKNYTCIMEVVIVSYKQYFTSKQLSLVNL